MRLQLVFPTSLVESKKVLISFVFGLFHFVMPIIGFYSGSRFVDFVSSFDHWIAFAILVFLGIKSIRESFENDKGIAKTSLKSIFLQPWQPA